MLVMKMFRIKAENYLRGISLKFARANSQFIAHFHILRKPSFSAFCSKKDLCVKKNIFCYEFSDFV